MNNKIKPIKKVIVPAAGWGTRFLPFTKIVPKELLPILNKPLIHYLAVEASMAGITELILVISPRKLELVKYFTLNDSLEQELKLKGKVDLLKKVKETNKIIKISISIQNKQLGLGHAISIASDLVLDEPFAVILGDDLINSKVPTIKQLIDSYNKHGHSVIGVQTVEDDKVDQYGIVIPANENDNNQVFKIKGAVEKPKLSEAPSKKAILGRYVFTPELMRILLQLRKDWNKNNDKNKGELHLAFAIEKLLEKEDVYAFEFEGTRYDLGSIEGFVKANIDLSLEDKELRPSIEKHLLKIFENEISKINK